MTNGIFFETTELILLQSYLYCGGRTAQFEPNVTKTKRKKCP